MSLSPGARLGPYEIVAPLGAGGMGEVFRARDERLGREVALKVLPIAFVADPERLARFEREARVLASLNHPNIAQVYGLEVSGPHRALVLELVAGPTLAERLEQGALPLEEAVDLASQIAEALEAAHDRGVVHRDLKPANVKLTPEGRAKVLDFGLAKALESEAASSSPSHLAHSPTLTQGATALGVILGTAAYMAPEQAKGKPVDKRADVWAFGAILFEMLTGRRLFTGETVTETLASVLREELDWSALPEGLPAPLRNLLRRSLERDPRRRLHDVADARIVLEEVAEGRWERPEAAAAAPPEAARTVARPLGGWRGWTLAFPLGGLATFLVLRSWPFGGAPAATGAPRAEYRQLTFLAGPELAPALAPDGESFAYVRAVGRQLDVFLQRVGGRNAVNLTVGCELDDVAPAFSPDGRQIAYRSECLGGGIFVMGALGESARKVTDLGHDPAWSPDGRELAVADERWSSPFGRGSQSKLWAVRVETGERRLLSEHDGVEPAWSPDGRRVAFWGLEAEHSERDLYTVAADGSQAAAAAAVRALDDPPVDWSPVWSADGRALLFASTRGGTMNLWRVPIDPASGEPFGAPTPLTAPTSWAGYLSISRDGRRLAFVDRNVRSTIRVESFDPDRGELGATGRSVPIGTFEVHERVDLTDDGSVLFASAGLPQHLFLADPEGNLRQLSDGPHRDRQATLAPDGRSIVFQSDRWGDHLGRIQIDGSGLAPLPTGLSSSAWYPIVAPDGSFLVGSSTEGPFRLPFAEGQASGPAERLPGPGDGNDFWPFSIAPDGRTLAGILRSPAGETLGIALLALEQGTYRQVTSGRDWQPVFLPDGRRLIYRSSTGIGLLDLASGATRELHRREEGTWIRWIDLSRDGRHLTWNESRDESDLWLATFDVAP